MALLGYVIIKAYSSSFTHDESYSYLYFTQNSFMDVLAYKNWFSNNHILNTIFIKYFDILFGSSELALRMPNIFLFVLFMLYTYFLFRKLKPTLQIPLFILMCSNVLLLDIFSMARGYGLSIGFMLISVFYFLEYLKLNNNKHLYLFHSAALLASLSNFTLLTVYSSLLVTYTIIWLLETKINKSKKLDLFNLIKPHIIPVIISFIVLFEPVRRVLTYNNLDFGGKDGLFSNTLPSLFQSTFQGIPLSPSLTFVLQIIYSSIILSAVFIIIKNAIDKKTSFFSEYKNFTASCLVLISLSMVLVVLHLVFKVDYPVGRFAIFIFPLFIVFFGFYMQYLYSIGRIKLALSLPIGLALISLYSLALNVNITSFSEWSYDMETKNMVILLEGLNEDKIKKGEKISLGIDWFFEPTINFYRQTKKLDWLIPVDRDGIDQNDMYFYILKENTNQIDTSKAQLIKEFTTSKTVLYKNKKLN